MKFLRSILLALSLAVAPPAFAQLPAIDAVAGPSTSAQLRRILTDETGTGVAIFGGGDANTLINLNGSAVATGTVAAARLPNAGVTTINGVSCTIGGICTITASAHSITVGVTDVLSGTSNGLLYNNAGDLGNLATSASGVLVTSAGSVPSISTTLPDALAMGTPASLILTNATGLPNAGLVNASTTVNGQTCTLGLTCTITAAASSLVPGTTTLTGGALNSNGLLFNSGNVLTNLASANNGVLVTNGSGVPSISTTLPGVDASGATVTALGSSIARPLQNRFADTINVLDYAVPDSCTTDNTSAITAAIAAAATAGKGVFFPAAAGSYCFAGSITLLPNVVLYGDGAAQLEWNGNSSDPMFTSSATTILYKSGIVGLRINSSDASIAFDLKSAYQTTLDNLYVTGSSATSTLLSITTNASGDTNPDGNRNAVFNYFANIVQEGTFGTFIYMSGRGVGSTPTSIVTLNTFMHLNATDIRVMGYNFAEWVDSNYFAGMQRVQINADNAIGAEFNTAAPTSNVGVYANIFDYLAVDTFGSFANRIGVRMNLTKQNKIGFLFNDPPAEGGSFVISNDTAEIDVKQQKGGTNDTYVYRRRVYEKGAQEILDSSDPFSIQQTWNNSGVVFNSFEINNTDTSSNSSSTLASWKIAGAAKFNFFKSGDSIQSGNADIGFAASTGTVTLGLARGRSGDGTTGVDFISDTTYAGGGLRITRFSGANGASWFTHRGTGPLSFILSEASSFSLSINGTSVVGATSAGISVAGTITNTSMPTSCSGQPSGAFWNNSNVVNVCP